jgi:hypothetical protein
MQGKLSASVMFDCSSPEKQNLCFPFLVVSLVYQVIGIQ